MKVLRFSVIAGVLVLVAMATEALRRVPVRKANNTYTLLVFPRYFILRDEDRVVDTIPFGNKGQLDTVILKDNQ